MAGPSWIAGALAALMILTAAYSTSRLAASRLRGRSAEADTDELHAVMGTAMAGMLVPQLTLLPGRAWTIMFGGGAAWFGACAFRARIPATASWRCRYPVPHLIECIAMLYMLLAVPAAQNGSAVAMPGMGASPTASASFPALTVVLALFMVGYVIWTADQLASLARAQTTKASPAAIPGTRVFVTVPAGRGPAGVASTAGKPGAIATADQCPSAGQVQLAPKLAAVSKIAMSVTMGYMLILML